MVVKMNNDLVSYLLYLGRNDRNKGRLLGPWIPKIRMVPYKITDVEDIPDFPESIKQEIANVLSEISRIPINEYGVPLKPDEIEFRQLVSTLPKDLRLRIFGYATQCYICDKRMHHFDQNKISDKKWLSLYEHNFCSPTCLNRYLHRPSSGKSILTESLKSGPSRIIYTNGYSDICSCLGTYCECSSGVVDIGNKIHTKK